MYQKNAHVFWVQTDEGMLLQNVHTNQFIELDKTQEIVWEYLDGTFSEEAISEVIISRKGPADKKVLLEKVHSTVELLKSLDMIGTNGKINVHQ